MPGSAPARGFSLIEMLVSVAIVGIVAALAVPSMLPTVRFETLQASGHVVSGFVAAARLAAMTQRRCVRIRLAPATAPPTLVAERLNSFDCENPSAPLIDDAAPLWIEIGKQALDAPRVVLALAPAPTGTPGEIRFRPSGRIFSPDANINDDDAVITITHPASVDVVHVLVDAPGMVCALPRGTLPLGTGNSLGCP